PLREQVNTDFSIRTRQASCGFRTSLSSMAPLRIRSSRTSARAFELAPFHVFPCTRRELKTTRKAFRSLGSTRAPLDEDKIGKSVLERDLVDATFSRWRRP